MMLRSLLDRMIAKLYWINQMTQEQIADILQMTQCAVFKRIRSLSKKLKFLILQPTQDPIQIRSDLQILLLGENEETIEVSYLWYFEGSLSRVATLMGISSSRSSSAARSALQILENNFIQGKGNPTAGIYLNHYRRILKSAGVLQTINKTKEKDRQTLIRGPSILG